ncbi:MAG: hypothetical protein KGZ83_21345 [Sulfuricella sp.]|nr:hypothetical protein [Sulfuricella sp.]
MTVYVIGGDHYDAQMGVKMLAQRGIAAMPLAITDSPEEYMLRAQDHPALQEHVFTKIAGVSARVFLVFCNTLSFSMDWEMLSARAGVPIVNLKTAYRELVADFKSVGVIAIHEHTLHNIRRFFDREHGKLETIGFSMMPLVESVEIGAAHINAVLGQLVGVSAGLGAEAFIFGCTHFEDCVVENSPIQIVYPGKKLLDYVIEKGYV